MPNVTLLSSSPKPLESIYIAYRVCYSALTPQQIQSKLDKGEISPEAMEHFINQRLATGHVSPLEQVWFEFAISDVSRAFSHQFVRTRVGISIEQQSQRYVTLKKGKFKYVTPPTIKERDFDDEYQHFMDFAAGFYDDMVQAGVPAEDARFVLPNAASTNLKITMNFAALLHMADLRLCTRAQWEYRKVAAQMRGEVIKVVPLLGKQLGPKCMENRQGYCDESREAYDACPLARVRPHKFDAIDRPGPWKTHNDADALEATL